MNTASSLAGWTARFAALFVLSVACVIAGGAIVGGALPVDAASEPGLVSPAAGLLVLSLAHLIVVSALVLGSRWTGWRLALALGLAHYGAVTVLMQIETWYFLSALTVDPELLPRLFLMGVPTATVLVPAAVWMLGKGSAATGVPSTARGMPVLQWAWKLPVIALTYLILYWGAGYFIAWQNPDLRAFYGRPGPPLPFMAHTIDSLRHDPMLFPLQILRSQLWVLCALPVIRGSRLGPGWTALVVGLLFSLPQNVGLLMENPLIPSASVRLSHLVETASSTFLFGTIVVWLLHREHHSRGDLLGLGRSTPDVARAPGAHARGPRNEAHSRTGS
jgi:hypothetical protein